MHQCPREGTVGRGTYGTICLNRKKDLNGFVVLDNCCNEETKKLKVTCPKKEEMLTYPSSNEIILLGEAFYFYFYFLRLVNMIL